jgi:hypothetical protein
VRLQIAAVGLQSGWNTLFEQEGLPFRVPSSPDELTSDEFSAIVVGDAATSRWKDAIRSYVKSGGGVLLSAEARRAIFGVKSVRKTLDYILADGSFWSAGMVDVHIKSTIIAGSEFCRSQNGDRLIHTEGFGNGVAVTLPFDAGSLIEDTRSRLKYFYARGGVFPSELVSTVDKGGVRNLVRSALEFLHHHRALPFCHFWYFPNGQRNLFSLRVDTDYGSETDVDALHRFAESKRTTMSWYLHVEAHESWLKRFAEMEGHEIGIHCHEHAALRTYDGAKRDLVKAKNLIEEQEINAVGFVAPFGYWTPDLGRVIDDLGFLYSSEFSYDYDNLPSYPRLGGTWGKALQIPVHPISIGSLSRAGFSEREMTDYFETVIHWKLATNEPLFFYHHPKDGHHEVLAGLIEKAHEFGYPTILAKDFASWWKERNASTVSFALEGSRLLIEGNLPPSVHIHLTKNDKECLLPESDRSVDLQRVQWHERSSPRELPSDIADTRGANLRLGVEALRIKLRRKYK